MRKSPILFSLAIAGLFAALPASATGMRCAAELEGNVLRVVQVGPSARDAASIRFDRLAFRAQEAGCDPYAAGAWQGRTCELLLGQLAALRDRLDAGAAQRPWRRANCFEGAAVAVGQDNPRLVRHVVRTAPEAWDMAGPIPVPTPRPEESAARTAAANDFADIPGAGAPAPARSDAVDATPAVDLTAARAIPADRRNVRVVGGRFLPDPDEEIDFHRMSQQNEPPLNEALNTVIDFLGPTEAVAAERTQSADKASSAGSALVATAVGSELR
jgi:hypothetical protein